ncbi:MAG TPA: hypothetical protein PKM39_09645, partial [Pseudothauera hydrothermalis]|nr:hypothetical protein [Pseudothauera hydrothermalis]
AECGDEASCSHGWSLRLWFQGVVLPAQRQTRRPLFRATAPGRIAHLAGRMGKQDVLNSAIGNRFAVAHKY